MSRKLKDNLVNGLVYAMSSLSVLVLALVIYFIFSKGFSALNIDLFTGSYWSDNYMVSFNEVTPGNFVKPDNLGNDVYFSTYYGIGLIDETDPQHEAVLEIVYADPNSAYWRATSLQAGHEGEAVDLRTSMWVEKFAYVNANGVTRSAGNVVNMSAAETIAALDSSVALDSAFIQSQGGGIFGSLISTLYLIGISLLFALPIGISTAIYLNEYAKTSKFTPYIRYSIELLTGVPSIIFGLMGVLVLFPITALFGASGTSILLGGLTMSIVLMPTIIRTTEESLKVVPQSFRDASLSLGANTSQTIFKIVLPSAMPGILTATLLGIGRIIGESAALIYTMGTFVSDDPTLLNGGTSLAVQIWAVMSGEQPNFQLASAISIIILAIVLIMNFSVKLVAKRLQKIW